MMENKEQASEKKAESRYIRCKRCNKLWNISENQRISRSGYVCPRCTPEEREKAKEKRKQVLKKLGKWIILTILGILIYSVMSKLAYQERGFKAYGGEVFFILLPIWWALIESTLNETKNSIASIKEEIMKEGGNANV